MKPKVQTKEYPLDNGRILTLTSIAEDRMVVELNPKATCEEDTFTETAQGTALSVGWAIKNPTDDVSPKNLGATISLGRATKTPIARLVLQNTRISDKLQGAIMYAVAEEINDRFYSFIPLGTNGKKKKAPIKGDTKKEENEYDSNRGYVWEGKELNKTIDGRPRAYVET